MTGDNYDDWDEPDDRGDEPDPHARRNRDAANARCFYAWREWKQQLKDHEERKGRRLSRDAYGRAKDAFRDRCQEAFGVGEPDTDWVERHMQWHEGRGSDPW